MIWGTPIYGNLHMGNLGPSWVFPWPLGHRAIGLLCSKAGPSDSGFSAPPPPSARRILVIHTVHGFAHTPIYVCICIYIYIYVTIHKVDDHEHEYSVIEKMFG